MMINRTKLLASLCVFCTLFSILGVQLSAHPNTQSTFAETFAVEESATAIAVGGHHACALLTSELVKCWGGGGKLGNGSDSDSTTPVFTSVISTTKKIAAGENHTCGVISSGQLYCWGENTYGQIGNNTTNRASRPVLINGVSGVLDIAGGFGHTCIVTTARTLKCWGRNENGEVGHPSQKTPLLSPFDVPNISNVKQVIAGVRFTCVLTQDGKVSCWGRQYPNDPENQFRPTPVQIGGLSEGVSAISGNGEHICALLNNSKVKCWGVNSNGELGNGSQTNSATPVEVSGLSGVQSVAAGRYHTCAIVSGGNARCWGLNSQGQLGTGNFNNSAVPVAVNGLGGQLTSMGLGSFFGSTRTNNTTIFYANFTCGLLSNQAVQCWGNNYNGQLGTGNKTTSPSPKNVSGLEGGGTTNNPSPTAVPTAPPQFTRKQYMPIALNSNPDSTFKGREVEPNHAKITATDAYQRKVQRRQGYVFANGPINYDDLHDGITGNAFINRDGANEQDDADWYYFDVPEGKPSIVVILGGPAVENWVNTQLSVFYGTPAPAAPINSFDDICNQNPDNAEDYDKNRFYGSQCALFRAFGVYQNEYTPYVVSVLTPRAGRYYVQVSVTVRDVEWPYHLKVSETQ